MGKPADLVPVAQSVPRVQPVSALQPSQSMATPRQSSSLSINWKNVEKGVDAVNQAMPYIHVAANAIEIIKHMDYNLDPNDHGFRVQNVHNAFGESIIAATGTGAIAVAYPPLAAVIAPFTLGYAAIRFFGTLTYETGRGIRNYINPYGPL